MNEQLYNVSANPHVRDKASTHSIMLDVIIALLPATLFGFWNFGVKAIINTVICILTCVISEYADFRSKPDSFHLPEGKRCDRH